MLLDWKANSGHDLKKCSRKGLRDTSSHLCVYACIQEGKKLQNSLILGQNPADVILGKDSSAVLEIRANSQG